MIGITPSSSSAPSIFGGSQDVYGPGSVLPEPIPFSFAELSTAQKALLLLAAYGIFRLIRRR